MPLQIRRGTTAQRLAITPIPGELIYDTTTGQIFVGNGTTAGGATTTGVSLEDAADAAAALFTSGSHTGIAFTYNDIAGRIDATITATAVGPFEGDLTGSVFADDSSLLVDAIDKRFIGNRVDTDRLTSNNSTRILATDPIHVVVNSGVQRIVSFDQHHNDAGLSSSLALRRSRGTSDSELDIQTSDIISSIASVAKVTSGYVASTLINSVVQGTPSSTAAPGSIEFYTANTLGTLQRVMAVNSNGSVSVDTNEFNSSSLVTVSQHHSGADIRAFSITRGRGSSISPTAIQPGDLLSKLNFNGYDGTGYSLSSQIRAVVDSDATVSAGAVAGKLEFVLGGNDGIVRSRMEIDAVKTVNFNQFWGVTSIPTGLPMLLLSNTNTVSDGARLMMRRSKGSYLAPTSVVNGDALFRLGWGGHDGTAYRDTAFIIGSVANTVSTNVVPTKLTVSTTNSIGTLTTALEISEEQVLKVNTVGSLSTTSVNFNSAVRLVTFADATARDTAIPSPVAGMMAYITGTGKFQGYNGITATWNDLN
jgi:Major tropism determinant N-terminal domain